MTRLIDADALKADIEQFNRPLCDDYHMKDYVLNQIITDIENQPTVDAVPVKRGKWTVTPIYIKCSECGESFMLIPQRYCPNCGARMDEE